MSFFEAKFLLGVWFLTLPVGSRSSTGSEPQCHSKVVSLIAVPAFCVAIFLLFPEKGVKDRDGLSRIFLRYAGSLFVIHAKIILDQISDDLAIRQKRHTRNGFWRRLATNFLSKKLRFQKRYRATIDHLDLPSG